ncbi:MAG: DUF433 domain-containing protein [Anaerolineae bacterium]|nr:DUF433 domain-containing protein [Anaerolineae bacterium]
MGTVILAKNLPITIDPNILGGIPVFQNTRVPVQTLFDYLADGYTLEEFLDNFPSVKREDALLLESAFPSQIVRK